MPPAVEMLLNWTEYRLVTFRTRSGFMPMLPLHGSSWVCRSNDDVPTLHADIFKGFVMFTVAREKVFLRELRQAYYLSKPISERLSSRTVLYLHSSDETITEDKLERLYGDGARKWWTVADVTDLSKMIDNRNSNAMALESAQVSLLRTLHKKKLSSGRGGRFDNQNAEKRSRPTHRLFPLIGQKVDAISFFRDNASKDAEKVENTRNTMRDSSATGHTAIFVEYANQSAARKAYHHLSFGRPLQLDPRFIGLQPKEVLWQNLSQGQASRLSKKSAATALVIATIIFWSIPVGIVGTISNINYLTDKLPFLRFIDNLPNWVLGLITGLLPPFLLSWLVSYVPKFFRSEYSRLCLSYMINGLQRWQDGSNRQFPRLRA